MAKNTISYEYIRGLIEGEGCFSFCLAGSSQNKKYKLPAFILSMSVRDKALIEHIRDRLCIRNMVYEYGPRIRNDHYKRLGTAILIIRDVGQLKNIVVPLCYKKLHGNKAKQFEAWIEKIGFEDYIPEKYKFIYKLYKAGFYEKVNKFD
jgi:hypothetical protein